MRKPFDTVEEFWTLEQVQQAFKQAGSASLTRFRDNLGIFLGVPAKAIHLMPSDHQGLEWLLRSKRDRRRMVMVPAFNCSVVQAAIEAAGYKAQLYDFSPRPGEFDWRQIMEGNH